MNQGKYTKLLSNTSALWFRLNRSKPLAHSLWSCLVYKPQILSVFNLIHQPCDELWASIGKHFLTESNLSICWVIIFATSFGKLFESKLLTIWVPNSKPNEGSASLSKKVKLGESFWTPVAESLLLLSNQQLAEILILGHFNAPFHIDFWTNRHCRVSKHLILWLLTFLLILCLQFEHLLSLFPTTWLHRWAIETFYGSCRWSLFVR